MLIIAICIEPLRYLSAWWMRRARETDASCTRVRILDMMHGPTSPLQAARQYCATLLFAQEGSGRLALLWRYGGFSNYDSWCRGCPGLVRELRRMLLVVDASLYRRHALLFKSVAWRLLRFADPRLSRRELDALADEWNSVLECCLSPGIARQVKTTRRVGPCFGDVAVLARSPDAVLADHHAVGM